MVGTAIKKSTRREITTNEFTMKCLNTEFFRRKFLLRASLVNYITEVYVAGRKSGSSCRHYRRLAELLKEFEQKLGRKILSDSFDETTSFQWVEFLRSTISKKINKAYCQSTLRYYYQKTISVLYSMARSGRGVQCPKRCRYGRYH